MPVFCDVLLLLCRCSLMNCELRSCDCRAEISVLVKARRGATRRKVEAAAAGLPAGSVCSFSTFCHKNGGNVMEENIIWERLYL